MKTTIRVMTANPRLAPARYAGTSTLRQGFFCSVLSVMLMFLAIASWSAEAEAKRPDLTGVVKSKSGQPISGAAAFIYTAAPKLGVGFL